MKKENLTQSRRVRRDIAVKSKNVKMQDYVNQKKDLIILIVDVCACVFAIIYFELNQFQQINIKEFSILPVFSQQSPGSDLLQENAARL